MRSKIGTRIAMAIVAVLLAMLGATTGAQASPSTFPRYDRVFLVIEENHGFKQIIGNHAAPEINALASDYGLASNYTGVADPSEPNYVAMLGGSAFGIRDDEPYFFPGHTVNEPNLMSQLESAGLTWKAYFQGMPYPGYRGYCFPAKCNGIPDSDTQYVAKHDGIVNFADMQTPSEFAKLTPISQLSADLASGDVPNFSYIVPDECHDMHGAPPWCVDSGRFFVTDDNWLVGTGDAYVGKTVEQITSSSIWKSGNNAIVVTFDEGNTADERVPTIVITNHGPRGVTDPTSYDHYSLLASIEHAFGLGCLLGSCKATPMTPLFEVTHSKSTPSLPAPFTPAPDGSNTISPTGAPVLGNPVALGSKHEWQVVPSPSIGPLDNNLAAVSSASPRDAWAVGDYLPAEKHGEVLETLGEHWDGTRWTAYPLPDVGPNENTLLGVSQLKDGSAWAVGYDVDAEYAQRTLIEHWDGSNWTVYPSPDPGEDGDILYGVAAIDAHDAWAVGAQEDGSGVWHPLAEHWDGSTWAPVLTPDPNGGGNLLYAVTATSAENVYAVGQTGTSFPSQALVEHWDGKAWSTSPSPSDPSESLDPLGATASGGALTLVGSRETSLTPYTALVAAGTPPALQVLSGVPNDGPGENDLFATTTAPNGSTWAVGWFIEQSSLDHAPLIEHGVGGTWSLVPTPALGVEESGLAGVSPAGGNGALWAVGITSNGQENPATLIEYRG